MFAVHISDGILQPAWWAAGLAAAIVLWWLAARRLQDEEIPRIALLTAAFFLTSLYHVKIGPGVSVHLLFNGLVGVLLGIRAPLAIGLGLFLQVLFINHGGFTTVGINTCILAVPALVCWLAFRALNDSGLGRVGWVRAVLIVVSVLVWYWTALYSIVLLRSNAFFDRESLQESIRLEDANALFAMPWAWIVGVGLALAAALWERRRAKTPQFALGLLLGVLAVLLTLAANSAVLLLGGETYWPVPILVLAIAHLPIAALEGIVLGVTLGFLARVKPEMLERRRPDQ